MYRIIRDVLIISLLIFNAIDDVGPEVVYVPVYTIPTVTVGS